MAVDPEEFAPKKPEPLGLGADLSRLSLHELDERIQALEREIERCRALKDQKEKSRDAADAVFKR